MKDERFPKELTPEMSEKVEQIRNLAEDMVGKINELVNLVAELDRQIPQAPGLSQTDYYAKSARTDLANARNAFILNMQQSGYPVFHKVWDRVER